MVVAPPARWPAVNAAAFKSQGDLAFVWQDLLYHLDGKSGAVQQLTDSGKASRPVWSHDGQWLAFIRLADAQAATGPLWLVHRGGTRAHQVQACPARSARRISSGRLSRIASLCAARAFGWCRRMARPASSTRPGPGIYQPKWSKDGSRILYVRDNALWLISAKGGEPQQVVGPFPGEPDLFGFYGYVSFSDKVAWFQP